MAQPSGAQPGAGQSGTGQSGGGQSGGGQSGSTASTEARRTESGSIPESRSSSEPERTSGSENSQGKTTIAAAVVQKIAGIAAREIDGVNAMGGGVSRTFGAIRERIPGGGTSSTSGVQVEVGEKQAAVDLDMIVEYGVSIADLARAVRRNVINAVERMTGLNVIEVNISVNDVHVPSDDNGDNRESPAPSRVE